MGHNHYDALGVSETATAKEIKTAYRRLAKQYHPDKNKGDQQAETRFKEVNEAYGVLSDDKKRATYDNMRKYGCGGGQEMPFGFNPSSSRNPVDFDFGDIGLGDLGSIFSGLGGMGGGRQRKRQRGADRLMYADVPFDTAARGGKLHLTVQLQERCAKCHGTGAEGGIAVLTCPQCQGSGTMFSPAGGFSFSRPCPRCCGRGNIIEKPCHTCHSEGIVQKKKTLALNIKPGLKDGQKIRIPGAGEPGPNGTPPGDLYVKAKVQPDAFFKADGYDIHCRVPLNIAQASLGAKIKIKTLEGSVNLRIPPGTQNNTRFRLRGEGIRRSNGSRGNQYVTIGVAIPKNLSSNSQELLRELAKNEEMKY